MVAVAIFADNGELYLMGKSRESAIDCAQKATTKRTYRYIEDEEQRLQYLSRAVSLMNGTEDEANGKYNSRGIAGHS